jgi:tRNA G46 methylase TrmB
MRPFQPSFLPKPELHFNPEILRSSISLDLEIGAGQGLHAINYAMQNPSRHLIAVEQTQNRFSLLEQRAATHQHLTNLTVVRADATAFTVHYIPDEKIGRVFILYPNPYPKKKQANLRWHNRPFLQALIAKMQSHGTLTLATNLEWYALEARESLRQDWHLEEVSFDKINPAQKARTHFEKKYLLRGEICWNLIVRKPSLWPLGSTAARPPVGKAL